MSQAVNDGPLSNLFETQLGSGRRTSIIISVYLYLSYLSHPLVFFGGVDC